MIIFDMVIRIAGFNNILRKTFGLSQIDLCLKPDIPYNCPHYMAVIRVYLNEVK